MILIFLLAFYGIFYLPNLPIYLCFDGRHVESDWSMVARGEGLELSVRKWRRYVEYLVKCVGLCELMSKMEQKNTRVVKREKGPNV